MVGKAHLNPSKKDEEDHNRTKGAGLIFLGCVLAVSAVTALVLGLGWLIGGKQLASAVNCKGRAIFYTVLGGALLVGAIACIILGCKELPSAEPLPTIPVDSILQRAGGGHKRDIS